MDRNTSDVELRDLTSGEQLVELPRIDTNVRRTNLGGSVSMPPSPTSGPSPWRARRGMHAPSAPHIAGVLDGLHETADTARPSAGHVQSGRMTKVTHYGRVRSVTARVLRMMDPRPSARQQYQQHSEELGGAGAGAGGSGSAQAGDGSRGTAAGLLGLSVVDTVRDAGRRRLHRHSHMADAPPSYIDGLARQMSHDSTAPLAAMGTVRLSMDALRRSEDHAHRLSRRSSRVSMATAEGAAAHAADQAIAIPMPGFFLDPASDYWSGGHSYRQRQRYPLEVITVPASLTKRVHYEVSYDYPKNSISTARYNVVTFLPAQLTAQFSKVANIYFLFIAALQQVPGWSTTGRWSTVLPLSVFVSLSIAHEGYDDLRRHRMDRVENTQHTRVLKVKVHDRDHVPFSFRELRHRGSHSIHSFRMRGSQSIHDMGRSTIATARRWAVSVITIGHTAKEAVVKHLAEKRRKRRELEDSDDEDEHLDTPAVSAGDVIAEGAESQIRRQIARGVISLRSWRGTARGEQQQQPPQQQQPGAEAISGQASVDVSDAVSDRDLRRPAVAFDEAVREASVAGGADEEQEEEAANPLPDNMTCRWKRKRWESVQVGDLVMITRDEWIPADCIVLASTGFDGTCFVETAALDGETTLKQKQALEATNSAIQTAEQLAAFRGFTYVEPPSAELYSFEGYMEVGGERHPLTPNQVLLRGSVLRNTAYVYAQVVYAGEQTRLRRNATRNVRTKAPQIQRITNRIVVFVLLMLVVLTVVFGGAGIAWDRHVRRSHWYLRDMHVSASALVFGYIVMMNALIPISLYVTLEAVKIFQCWFIERDAAMYHAASNTCAEARTTAINEDLGMVRYVFSDKTGTLTENIMKLRAVMCGGFSYLHIDLDRLQGSAAAAEGSGGSAGHLDHPPATPPRSASRQSPVPSRPGSPSPGLQAPLPSPSLFRAQLFSRHRRQQSLPSPSQSPRGAPATVGSSRPSPLGGRPTPPQQPRHVRGASASVLRAPAGASQSQGRSGLQNELLPRAGPPAEPMRPGAVASLPLAAPEDEPLLPLIGDAHMSGAQLERAAVGGDKDDGDPDLIGPGEAGDPRAHTRAADDVLVSDLQALPSTRRILDAAVPSEVFRARAEWFLRCLALCHTVQPDRDPLTGRITGYQATSPDEKALVAAAAELGYVMNNRAGPLVQLRVVAQDRMRAFNRAVSSGVGQPAGTVTAAAAAAGAPASDESAGSSDSGSGGGGGEDGGGGEPSADESFDRGVPAPHVTDSLGNYEVLDVLEFSSARKRMSVILRCPDGRIVMMAKGADSAIWPRLCAVDRLRSDPGDLSFMPRPTPPARARPGAGQTRRRPSGLGPVARLADDRMYFGELGIGARRILSGTDSSAVSGDDGPDADGPLRSPSHARLLSHAPQHRRLLSESQLSTVSDASSFADATGRVEVPAAFGAPTGEEEAWARARALEALHQFSTEGLRTLAYAHREIEPGAYESWHARYVQATTALANRQQQIEAVCEEIERDLLLSGVSAIEDRLQEGVPETIFKLRRAGIRVWMLTGDKVETAINIAKSCRLVETDVVETTALDHAVLDRHPGRMAMLVLQSYKDIDQLDRVVSAALEVAERMTATVDQRFEARSLRARLRRGLRTFGNLLRAPRRTGRPAATAGGPPPRDKDGDADGDDERAGSDESGNDEWSEGMSTALHTVAADRAGPAARASDPGRTLSLATAVSQGTRGADGTLNGRASKQPLGGAEAEAAAAVASLAVVVDGETLALLEAQAGRGLLDRFLRLGTLSDAVICSRVSPAQKALVVHEMRVRCEGGSGDGQRPKKEARRSVAYRWVVRPLRRLLVHDDDSFRVTLAIGDGGNDIAMIQESHVGIGIAGQEGLQASRAADFSIGQFRFLQRLVLVHGRWSYVRVSQFVMGTFYKCMAFYLTQLVFQFMAGFSGTSLFESWTLSMYNTLFSILPVLVVGVFEQDLRPHTLLDYPELYRDMGPRNHLFTVPEFLRRVVVPGILHAIVTAYLPLAADLHLGEHAASNDRYTTSVIVYGIMVLTVALKIAYMDVRRWVLFTHLAVVASLALWLVWNAVLGGLYPTAPQDGFFVRGVFSRLIANAAFWLQWIVFATIPLCLSVLLRLVYSVRDPVERRLAAWCALERSREHAQNKARRREWLRNPDARSFHQI